MLCPREGEIDHLTAFGFIVKMEPRGKGRPRGTIGRGKARLVNGHVVRNQVVKMRTDEKTRSWKEEFQLLALGAKRASREQIERLCIGRGMPLRIELECLYKKPKTADWFCTSPIDNDNAEKNVWDAMQKMFFKNDNRIVSNETLKDWSDGDSFIRIRVVGFKKKETK